MAVTPVVSIMVDITCPLYCFCYIVAVSYECVFVQFVFLLTSISINISESMICLRSLFTQYLANCVRILVLIKSN